MPLVKPMLADEPSPDHPLRFPFWGSVKLDGIRIFKHQGEVRTRSLKPVPNAHIAAALKAGLPEGADGEIIIGEPNLDTTYSTTFSAVSRHKGEPEFKFYCFDNVHRSKIPYCEWYNTSLMPDPDISWFSNLLQTQISNQDQLDWLYRQNLSEGYEGAILRAYDSPYKYGRSSAKEQYLLKLKPFADREARIVGIYEAMHNTNEAFTNELGRTARSTAQVGLVGNGMVGGFIVDDELFGETDIAVGKFNHGERALMWTHREAYIGKLLKYRYMNYGIVEGGKPRFPRALGLRLEEDT